MDGDACFSPQVLTLLGGIALVIQGVIVYLFRGWMGALKDQLTVERLSCQDALKEARLERDRAYEGWESVVGLGERAVATQQRRERRPRS